MIGLVNGKGFGEFGEDGVEIACFGAVGCGDGVAVHGVADPEDAVVGIVDGLNEGWEFGFDLVGAEAVDESEAAGFLVGVEDCHELKEIIGCGCGSDFYANGVADTAKEFEVGAVEFTGAFADPREVGGEIVMAIPSWDGAGAGGFVAEIEAFVAGKEFDAAEFVDGVVADTFHETDGVVDFFDEGVVFVAELGVFAEAEIPIFGVMEISEAAVDESTDEIEGHGGVLETANHEVGVGGACFFRERIFVDEVAEVTGEGDVAARFGGLGSGFGVLAGEASDADDGFAHAKDEDEAHLEEDFEFTGDSVGGAIDE